jgi:hypothetical protein
MDDKHAKSYRAGGHMLARCWAMRRSTLWSTVRLLVTRSGSERDDI